MQPSTVRCGSAGIVLPIDEMEQSELTVPDAVYGTFRLPSFVRAVTEAHEFVRLKYLKQLGVSNAVFGTARHTRYDHSLGACYLSGRLLDAVNKTLNPPVTEDERKCVMLAAALHDIGHGPFSHLWEKFVEVYGAPWRHERSSVELAQRVLDRLENVSVKQIALICALIRGDAADLLTSDRQFLAHIVSSDVDVDRCDYLQRDAHHVPGVIEPSRPFRQMFDRVRVVTVEGKARLAYHWQDYPLVYEMACARQAFHRRCYQDVEVLGAELMMLDVMHEAERAGFRFTRDGNSEPLSKVHDKPELFRYLNDNITSELAASKLPGLDRAKALIARLQSKDLYKEVIRFSIDMIEEVNKFNHQQGKPIVAQAFRYIKSTKQWFGSFNVTFYKPSPTKRDDDDDVAVVSLEEARDLNHSNTVTGESAEEIKEYIIYCTDTNPAVHSAAQQYFAKLRGGSAAKES
uniref:HD domain-containing protein n=1 Tax=Anopheles quadriannulatus TaxID=34691 RepID=A0A182XM45_ANOQN